VVFRRPVPPAERTHGRDSRRCCKRKRVPVFGRSKRFDRQSDFSRGYAARGTRTRPGKIAVLAPIPSASVMTATTAKPRFSRYGLRAPAKGLVEVYPFKQFLVKSGNSPRLTVQRSRRLGVAGDLGPAERPSIGVGRRSPFLIQHRLPAVLASPARDRGCGVPLRPDSLSRKILERCYSMRSSDLLATASRCGRLRSRDRRRWCRRAKFQAG